MLTCLRAGDTLSFKRLSNDEGTLNEVINDITQDEHGFIWFASDNGVTRFDGENYISFTSTRKNPDSLSVDIIISILYVDKSIWALAKDGVLHKLLANGNFQKFTPFVSKNLDLDTGHMAYDSEDHLWIAIDNSLYQFSLTKKNFLERFEFSDKVTSLYLDPTNENLTIGLESGQVKSCHLKKSIICLNDIYYSDNEYLIKVIKANNLIYHATTNNIYAYKNKYDNDKLLLTNLDISIQDIVASKDNKLWIATSHSGLFEYNLLTQKLRIHKSDFNDPYSLNSNSLNDLFIDKQEQLWIGSRDDGVFNTNLFNTGFQRLVASDLVYSNTPRDNYYHITENTKGELFLSAGSAGFRILSTDRKVFKDLSNKILKALFSKNKNFTVKRHIYISDSDIWLMTTKGLIHWDGNFSAQIIRPPKKNNNPTSFKVNYIHQDTNENIWISSNQGVYIASKLHENYFLRKATHISSRLTKEKITFIDNAFDHSLWIGTSNSGLYLVENDEILHHFEHNSDSNIGLANNHINDIETIDRKIWWVATKSGLSKISFEKNHFLLSSIENFDQNATLGNDSIYTIQKDSKGFLWLATNDGIIKFNMKNNTSKLYDYSHGLPRGAYNFKSSIYSKDGYIYFGGKKGLAKINSKATFKSHNVQESVVFTSYRKSNQIYNFIYPEINSSINLEYNNTNVQISYAKLDLTASEYIQYEYRLLNHNSEWALNYNTNFVIYNHIEPGKYKLQVREKGDNKNIAEIIISVSEYPWLSKKAYFFYFLVFLTVILFIAFYVRRKILIRKKHEQQLYTLANYDTLTSLPNRNKLTTDLPFLISINANTNILAILLIDLDRFKNINDSLGHLFGDKVLQYASRIIRNKIPKSAQCYRFAGDEFIVILPNLPNHLTSESISTKLLASLNCMIIVDGIEINLSASMGISQSPQDSIDGLELLKYADSALYAAKNAGKRTLKYYEPILQTTFFRRQQLESTVNIAFSNKDYYLEYQPKYCFVDNKIVGFESLLRWEHEKLGLIPPNEFIPILEEMGMIIDVGRWVISESLRQLSYWRKTVDKSLTIAINVSVKQLENSELLNEIKSMLIKYHLPACCLEIEITETVLIQNINTIMHTLLSFRNLGVRLSIDDFGTGYSSFYYLSQLPVDKIKVDKAFVDNIALSEQSYLLFKAIISMAHSLKLDVIAEGVENEQQYKLIQDSKCQSIQGYFIGRPVKGEEISKNTSKVYSNTIFHKNKI